MTMMRRVALIALSGMLVVVAGWYVVFINLRRVGFINLAIRPWEVTVYSPKWSK